MHLAIARAMSAVSPSWISITCRALPPAAGSTLAGLQVLERHLAAHELGLEHVPDGFELEVVGSAERDLLVLGIQLDGRRHALEVVALGDLLGGLGDGIVDLVEVHSVVTSNELVLAMAISSASSAATGGARLGLDLERS